MKFCYKGFLIDYDYIFNFHKENIIFLHGWGGDKKSFEFMYNLLTNKFNILSILTKHLSCNLALTFAVGGVTAKSACFLPSQFHR